MAIKSGGTTNRSRNRPAANKNRDLRRLQERDIERVPSMCHSRGVIKTALKVKHGSPLVYACRIFLCIIRVFAVGKWQIARSTVSHFGVPTGVRLTSLSHNAESLRYSCTVLCRKKPRALRIGLDCACDCFRSSRPFDCGDDFSIALMCKPSVPGSIR